MLQNEIICSGLRKSKFCSMCNSRGGEEEEQYCGNVLTSSAAPHAVRREKEETVFTHREWHTRICAARGI